MKNNRERVLAALLACTTEREAAECAGVSEKTVRNYLADEEFRLEYAQRRREMVERSAAVLQKNMVEAVETIAEVMRNATKPNERLAASKVILEYGVRYTELYDILERLAAVEEVIRQ